MLVGGALIIVADASLFDFDLECVDLFDIVFKTIFVSVELEEQVIWKAGIDMD